MENNNRNKGNLKNKIFNFIMAGGLLINLIVIGLLLWYSLFK